MKNASMICAALLLAACEPETVPTRSAEPYPFLTPDRRIVVRGMVVNEAGECIRGALVMIGGAYADESIEQKVPCTKGDFSNGSGFTLDTVRLEKELIIYAWAPGYAPLQRSIIPRATPVSEVFLTLSRSPELRSR